MKSDYWVGLGSRLSTVVRAFVQVQAPTPAQSADWFSLSNLVFLSLQIAIFELFDLISSTLNTTCLNNQELNKLLLFQNISAANQ